jgi:Asp-tRNA(Asn)/Glu-tRNA(Gln) amidotransferase A subunit family amidase
VPAGEYDVSELSGDLEDTGKLPFGVMFLASSRMDAETLELARRFEKSMVAKA